MPAGDSPAGSSGRQVAARPVLLPALAWVILALVTSASAALWGVTSGSPLSVQLGATVARAAADVAGVTCVGMALVGVLLPRPERLSGAALRTRTHLQAGLDRAMIAVAGGWAAAVALGIAFRAADAFGTSLSDLGVLALRDWTFKLSAGRGMVLSAACAIAVLVLAMLRLRDPERFQNRLPLVIALFGVLTPAVTGHGSTSPDHQLAVVVVALHAGAAALWVGGLAAVLATLGRHRTLLATVLPRFSRLAGACLFTVGLTGVVNALLRLSSPAALLDTPYGWLVLAKAAALVVLAGLGGLARQRLTAGRQPVLRWAGLEVALMAITLGLTAALTQMAG